MDLKEIQQQTEAIIRSGTCQHQHWSLHQGTAPMVPYSPCLLYQALVNISTDLCITGQFPQSHIHHCQLWSQDNSHIHPGYSISQCQSEHWSVHHRTNPMVPYSPTVLQGVGNVSINLYVTGQFPQSCLHPSYSIRQLSMSSLTFTS